jgi:aryl-alcohol dehydrogenase-like predicted oxidoreductase
MDRPILPRVERPVSRIVLGQSALPGDLPGIYDRFVELGGNAFETARWYPTEPDLGRWLAGRSDRAELFVISKGCHPAFQDGPPRVNSAAIRTDLTESLERLGVDRIDLYLLHRDDESVPVGEIMSALAEHRAAGRIGAAGGSNWTAARLAEANAWALANGVAPFEVGSPNLALALATRPPWDGCVVAGDPASLAWYTATQLPLLAWAALARAFFVEGAAGKTQATAFGADTRAVDIAATKAFDSPVNRERRERARSLGHELGSTANQVALAWVLNQPFPTRAVIGVRSIPELDEAAAVADLRLTAEQVRWLADGTPNERPATR